MRKLKISKYAFFVEKENGTYIAYSSLSGAVVVFNEEQYINLLKMTLSEKEINYQDNIINQIKGCFGNADAMCSILLSFDCILEFQPGINRIP